MAAAAATSTVTSSSSTGAIVVVSTALSSLFLLHWAIAKYIPSPPKWWAGVLPLTSTSPRPHRLYVGKTTHARIEPAAHTFAYPVFYFGINLDAVKSIGLGWLLGVDRWGVFSIKTMDFLGPVPGISRDDEAEKNVTIKQRLLEHLNKFGVPSSEIGEVELVTMPRFFGFAFNPLNTYYCFEPVKSNSDAKPRLRATLLEVNNTFGERHLYLCDDRNSIETTRQGYDSSHEVKRSFHVSPFNNRTGVYEAHLHDPRDNRMDVALILRKYGPEPSEPFEETAASLHSTTAKHFYARVFAPAYPLNVASLVHLLAVHPITALMTLPRIMYEAWRLAYKKGLPVYQRPNPVKVGNEGGGTIVRKKLDSFQKYSEIVVLDHLQSQSTLHNIPIQLHVMNEPIKTIHPRPSTPPSSPFIKGDDENRPISLYISSPNFFLRLLMDGTDIGRALSTTFARGDWTTTKADLVRFLNLMLATEKSSTKKDMSSIVLAGARRRYHGVGGVSPFRSHKWQKVVEVPEGGLRQAVKIAWGVATVWMEEKWFAATTVFVRDPYSIAERVADMVSEAMKDDSKIVDEEGEAGKLLGEFGDEIPGLEREKLRTLEFLRAFRTVVGEPRSF